MHSQFGIELGKKLTQLLNQRGYSVELVGCSHEEIDKVKQSQGVSDLPELFILFLESMGKKCGDIFMNGFNSPFRILSKTILFRQTAKARLNEAMKRTGKHKLDSNAIVFMEITSEDEESQDSWWWYFISTATIEDPIVHFYWDIEQCNDQNYIEDMIELYGTLELAEKREVSSFSEFLTRFIAEYESVEAQKDFLEKYT